MPIVEELMDMGEWTVSLLPSTPRSVLDAVDVRTYAYASIVVTPQWFRVGDLSDANLLSVARYVGVYLAQSDGRLNLEGAGLAWWLGDETDGGDLYTGNDGTSSNEDLEAQLDSRVFTSFANGLTKGTVDTLATARTIKLVMGTTRRQFLDTICALYPSGPYEWRINTDGTVDVNQKADLYSTTGTPTTMLTRDGGRDNNVTGIRAEFDLAAVDVSDYRTDVYVNWDDTAADHGLAQNTPASTWVDFAGAAPDLTTLINWKPKPFQDRRKYSKFDEGTKAWNKGVNNSAAKFAAWTVNSQTQANEVATRHANAVGNYAVELGAEINEYDPWRFVQVGDTVYVYDIDLGLVDTSNEVYFRGQVTHPQELRVFGMAAPILEGYGVYLRYWNGASFSFYDLTQYVDFEEDTTSLEVGTRARYHRKNARPRRFNRRAVNQRARGLYRFAAHLDA